MFKLSLPTIDILKVLIKESASASYVDIENIDRLENINTINGSLGNTHATLYQNDGSDHEINYNRISLETLFGTTFCSLRRGKIDWFDQAETRPRLTTRFFTECTKLYGVDLDKHVRLIDIEGQWWVEALETSYIYYGKTKLHIFDSMFNTLPINLLTGYDVVKFKGVYTLTPINPYPVNGYLYTSDPDYDPNGDIWGKWEQDTPLILSGDVYDLMRMPVATSFEWLTEWPQHDDIKVICLNPDAEAYNTGLARRVSNQWEIILEDSPLKGEFVNEVRRDEMTTGIKTYMIIWKRKGHLANIDDPEYRWLRVE
jgi:hypothetical protein